jgi:hypothetical protein
MAWAVQHEWAEAKQNRSICPCNHSCRSPCWASRSPWQAEESLVRLKEGTLSPAGSRKLAELRALCKEGLDLVTGSNREERAAGSLLV